MNSTTDEQPIGFMDVLGALQDLFKAVETAGKVKNWLVARWEEGEARKLGQHLHQLGLCPADDLNVGMYAAVILRAFNASARKHLGEVPSFKDSAELPGVRESLAALREATPAEPQRHDLWTGHPRLTPMYRLLFAGISQPLSPDQKQNLELDFDIRIQAELAHPDHRWAAAVVDRVATAGGHMWKRRLARDMISWRYRHIFGNQRKEQLSDSDEFLAVDDIYVEPTGRMDGRADPLLPLLEVAAAEHRVTAVVADFGHGKSMSARQLCGRLARRWLEGVQPAADGWYPLFVRCPDCLRADSEVLALIRSATQDALRAVEWNEDVETVPDLREGQKLLVLLDGLDEVQLGHQAVEQLFEKLDRAASKNLHFLVFSRPAALPRELKKAARVDVLGFSAPQATDWLQRWRSWRGSGPRLEALEEGGLEECTTVPILLYMTASVWKEGEGAGKSLAEVYERYMRTRARGKHEQDCDDHPQVAQAAKRLLDALKRKKLLTQGDEVEAMLWLMSRLAWESLKLEQRNPPEVLTRQEVGQILKDVGLSSSDRDYDHVILGVLLVLQQNPESGNTTYHFGHRSFREFLVAWYWQDRLRAMVTSSRPESEGKQLLGGRISGGESGEKHWRFLQELLMLWPEADRSRLFERAGEWFNDEHADYGDETDDSRKVWRNDLRHHFREVMLGVRCLGERGFKPAEGVFRMWAAWFMGAGDHPVVWGHGLDLSVQELHFLVLVYAKFSHATLVGATLNYTNLAHATLSGAKLSQAVLNRVLLHSADLTGADLTGATLTGATLTDASLSRATLIDADIKGADLSRANLTRANLTGADLTFANLTGTNLTGANLTGTNLDKANLIGATLPAGFQPPPESILSVDDPRLPKVRRRLPGAAPGL